MPRPQWWFAAMLAAALGCVGPSDGSGGETGTSGAGSDSSASSAGGTATSASDASDTSGGSPESTAMGSTSDSDDTLGTTDSTESSDSSTGGTDSTGDSSCERRIQECVRSFCAPEIDACAQTKACACWYECWILSEDSFASCEMLCGAPPAELEPVSACLTSTDCACDGGSTGETSTGG